MAVPTPEQHARNTIERETKLPTFRALVVR
jgi:hypothetical protein